MNVRIKRKDWTRQVVRLEIVQSVDSCGVFGGHLYRYCLVDGTLLTEYVQSSYATLGPAARPDDVVFLVALKDAQGVPIVNSVWTKDEIRMDSPTN